MSFTWIWESRDKRDNGRRIRQVEPLHPTDNYVMVENLNGTNRRLIRFDVLRRTYKQVQS